MQGTVLYVSMYSLIVLVDSVFLTHFYIYGHNKF